MPERLGGRDTPNPEEPDQPEDCPGSRDSPDWELPADHRWRPVEYGNADPDKALTDLDQEAEPKSDPPERFMEFDQAVWDRLPEWEPGDKARAWFVTEQGESFEISGKDPETKDTLRPVMPRIDFLVIADHVEGHVSARMRREDIPTGTLYINREPCAGQAGCDALLPRLLPPGATLAVYGPDGFSKVYEGLPEGDR